MNSSAGPFRDRIRFGSPSRLSIAIALFTLAFCIRVTYVCLSAKRTKFELDRAAVSLARHGTIGNVFAEDTGPTAHLSPLPVLVRGATEWLFGPATWASWFSATVLTCATTSAAIALLPSLALSLQMSQRAGIAAGFLTAIVPFRLWSDTEPGHETSLVTLTLIGVILAFTAAKASHWRSKSSILALSALCAVSALLSPPVLLAALSLLALAFLSTTGSRLQVVSAGLVIALSVVLAITPWAWRNYRVFGKFIPFRSNFGLELLIGNNPDADGRTYAAPIDVLHPFNNAEERHLLIQLGEPAYMQLKLRTATDWIESHPKEFARLCVRRFRLFWFPPPEMWTQAVSPAGRWMRSIWFSGLGLLAWAELLRMFVCRHPARGTILVVFLSYSCIYWFTHVEMRYPYPLQGICTLLAAEGLFSLGTVFKNRPIVLPDACSSTTV